MARPDLVVFGNLLLDDVVHDDGTTRMGEPGGAALYCALGAALWEIPIGIVSRIGNDYPESVLEALERRGIDLAGITGIDRPGLRTWLLYEGDLRRVVHRLGGPTHEDVSPTADDLPISWHRAGSFHLAPMPLHVQRRLAKRLAAIGVDRLSLDPYELLTEAGLDRWTELLSRIDLLLFSEDEMELEGGREDPLPALRRLVAGGRPRHILFKRGARGGLHLDVARGTAHPWPPRPGAVVDATGAGDAFTGGLLAGLARGETFARAAAMGSVSASFALEAEGAAGLLGATPEQARSRLRV